MLKIEKIDTTSKTEVNRFVRIPFQFYKNTPEWVPPILIDMKAMLNENKHPFYEHSDAEFFVAVRDGEDVGRIGVLENRRFNEYHGTHDAQFYFFECEESLDTATVLFEHAYEWAKDRGLDAMVGPKGMGPLDGYGVLVRGHEHRNTMTMLNYNYPYYQDLLEAQGFEKEVDFVSCYLPADNFKIPERVDRIAKRVMERGNLRVKRFKSKKELLGWANRIGVAYNASFVNNTINIVRFHDGADLTPLLGANAATGAFIRIDLRVVIGFDQRRRVQVPLVD